MCVEEVLVESGWPRVAAALSPFCGEFVILDTCLDYQHLRKLLQGRAHTRQGSELHCGTDTLLKAQMPPQCQLEAYEWQQQLTALRGVCLNTTPAISLLEVR